MKYTGSIDLSLATPEVYQKYGITEDQFINILNVVGSLTEYTPREPYSDHIRDLSEGWIRSCTVDNFSTAYDFSKKHNLVGPGIYALVYKHPMLKFEAHPMFLPYTITFGETCQSEPAKRIYQHVGALKGKTTNMTQKWNDYEKTVNRYIEEAFKNSAVPIKSDIKKQLDRIEIWFRPHEDYDWRYNKEHSKKMEIQAHAWFEALWCRNPPGNGNVSMPTKSMVKEVRQFIYNKLDIEVKSGEIAEPYQKAHAKIKNILNERANVKSN